MVAIRSNIQGPVINKAFKPLYTSNKRYFILTGGRGSLKSSSLHDFIVRLTYEVGHGVLFTRWTMVSAETSIIPEFKETITRLGVENDFIVTHRRIINKKSGSFILFSGIKAGSTDNTARLKSIPGITTWVVEEAEDFVSEKLFDTIDDSVRTTNHKNRVIFVMNPTSREHWIYRRFILDHQKVIKVKGFDVVTSNHPQVEHIHTTYHIAEALGYLDNDWLVKARHFLKKAIDTAKGLPKHERRAFLHSCHYYSNYIGGWLMFAPGAIYRNWTTGEFDPSLPIGIGLDFGYSPDPLAVVRIAINYRAKKIYIKELAYELEVDDVPGLLKRIGIRVNTFIVTDTNEPRTTAKVAMKFPNTWPAKKGQGSVVQGIRDIKTYDLIIDPTSMNAIREFSEYAWADGKDSVPAEGNDHIPDAVRYIFTRMTLRKEYG